MLDLKHPIYCYISYVIFERHLLGHSLYLIFPMVTIHQYDQNVRTEGQLVEAVRKHFDLRPAGIIKMLDLKHPIYKQTAAYGHFGRTDDFNDTCWS
jgi:S-adenosylmethionine synthetase